jgi:GNAT superfamily N-acetyltransferase
MIETMEIRLAGTEEGSTILEHNLAMAWETERVRLDRVTAEAGVRAVLANPHLGFYVVAEEADKPVASLMITPEWSDWRNATFWWVQSVYVRPEYRRRGVYRALYAWVKRHAAETGSVCGFRLYVERENEVAQQAYRALGMYEAHYRMFEEMIDRGPSEQE